MKVETSVVTKILITTRFDSKFSGVDTISVYIEDLRPGEGKITITCHDKSWSSTWLSMGKNGTTMKDFFISCDKDYLCQNLFCGNKWQTDFDAIPEFIRRRAVETRLDGRVTKEEARIIYDFAATVEDIDPEDYTWFLTRVPDEVVDIWPGFPLELPTRISDECEYLYRIIPIVQEALRTTELRV